MNPKFQAGNSAVFSCTTYFKLQTSYLVLSVKSVSSVWQQYHERLFSARRDTPVKLAGDRRCDSPGHTAKYGSYNLMDAETSEVLQVELVQVR